MAHTFTNLLTHVVFSTKGHHPEIDSEIRPRLMAYLGGIVRELKGHPMTINGAADHVHLLFALPPTLAIADALRVIKTNSSRWIKGTSSSRRDFAWQIGYGAFSVSQSNAAAVQKYIARQEEHHRRVSFQEELVTYLKKHGIEYDERYIWE